MIDAEEIGIHGGSMKSMCQEKECILSAII